MDPCCQFQIRLTAKNEILKSNLIKSKLSEIIGSPLRQVIVRHSDPTDNTATLSIFSSSIFTSHILDCDTIKIFCAAGVIGLGRGVSVLPVPN